MDNQAYIINLAFGAWQNQLWFTSVEDSDSQHRWADAKQSLEEIGSRCTNSNEFFLAAVRHFEEYGFQRIQK